MKVEAIGITYHPFTDETLKNRELIIKMLQYEDSIILSDKGQQIYKQNTNNLYVSLASFYIIHRMVLNHFNFTTTDQDVLNYRKIFKTYYKSPIDYDKDVINSVTYMRENKCIFYDSKVIEIGEQIPDVVVHKLDGTKTSLQDEIKIKVDEGNEKIFVGAFSNS